MIIIKSGLKLNKFNDHRVLERNQFVKMDAGLLVNDDKILKQTCRIIAYYTGLKIQHGKFRSGVVVIEDSICDSIQSFTNDIQIKELVVSDRLQYSYSKHCHKDIMQMFRAIPASRGVQYQLLEELPVRRVIVEKADIFVRGGKDKGGFIASEIGGIEDSVFFSHGIKFNTSSENPYFFSATRASNVTLGSPQHPIDPKFISNKAIRIGGIKSKAKDSGLIMIHAKQGLKLELSPQARSVTRIAYHS